MSFGQKPSAWARPQGASQAQQLNPNLFTNQLGLATAAGQAFPSIPGMPINSGLLVNQAAFTNMNVLAQAQRQILPQQIQQQQQQQRPGPAANQPGRSHRTFIGIVTKLMETYGFVDEDVFFQTNVIRGALPRVGDRVMVEANYNPSMPFKWNARSIEKMQNVEYRQDNTQQQTQHYPSHQSRQQQQQNGISTRWGERTSRDDLVRESRRQIPSSIHRSPPKEPPSRGSLSRQRSPVTRRSPQFARRQESITTKRERDRETRNEPDLRERDRESTRAQSSKRETVSPPRRRQRIIPRYHCNLPKQPLHSGVLKYTEMRKRYSNLYIPSDFIRCEFDWINSIKLETPLHFSPHPVNFHILNKDVDLPLGDGEHNALENPQDVDNRYVVKILLVSHPGVSALRRRLCGLLPDGSIDESNESQPLSKNIQLLVGYRGKGELMCIGGAWSPSIDGENPMDPQTIVKTAIRTTRTLTGIDLSGCVRWYKMLHLHYFRPERSRIDSCVLLLPDTSSVPEFKITEEQYHQAEQTLQNQLAAKLSTIDAEQFIPPSHEKTKEKNSDELGASSEADDGPTQLGECGTDEDQHPQTADGSHLTQTSLPAIEVQQIESTEMDAEIDSAEKCGSTSDEVLETPVDSTTTKKNGKTHWSILEQNIKAMKVAELRDELDSRQLDSKGVKNVLMSRLQEAIDKEKADMESNKLVGEQEQQVVEGVNEQEVVESQGMKESIVVQIKEEIIELMETDEAGEKTEEISGKLAEKEIHGDEQELHEIEKCREKFEKEKKERKALLERHYGQIPKNEPGIFVYPNKTAKSGKFDCKLMSLHSLLEYNKEHDNKEASFEVFLFAEALKEAYDRSNAFIVYHTVSTALEREAEKKRRNESLSEACKDDDVVVLDSGSKKDEKEEKSKSPTSDLRTNFRALVNDFEAFMAFSHFDSNTCGYIVDKDLEDIIHYTGLDLSRWDVQHLIKKLSSKDRVNYRDFTDKWVDKEGNIKYVPTSSCENLFQSYFEHANARKSLINAMDVFTDKTSLDVNKSGCVVLCDGALVNIKQSIELQSKMERVCQEVLNKNEQLELQLNGIKEQRDYLEKKKRRLEDDIDRCKKKLHETEKYLKKEQEDNTTLRSSLQDCKRYSERVIGVVEKIFPTPKKEEKQKDGKTKEKDNDVVVLDGATSDKAGSQKKEEYLKMKPEGNVKKDGDNGCRARSV